MPRSIVRARGTRHADQLRLAALGNAVVPQVAEFVGRRLMKLHLDLEKKNK